ncbi:hypothetical protein Tco_0624297 [Tanacetum coccineum]|uniref:Uncharacterized protein n=1 Tax=Tanacetum coccineum TaxID=301880 RepID=A0ABQ4WDN5_9ASTR
MAKENYVEGCSMQRSPLLEPNGFCFWKARFKAYVKSKDIDLCGFTRFNAIVTSLKSLDPNYSSKNHLVGNLKVYEMILENDSVVSKTTTKDKVKSLALKAKFTGEQTINDSDSQDGSDEDIDEEEEAEAFNLLARNF